MKKAQKFYNRWLSPCGVQRTARPTDGVECLAGRVTQLARRGECAPPSFAVPRNNTPEIQSQVIEDYLCCVSSWSH